MHEVYNIDIINKKLKKDDAFFNILSKEGIMRKRKLMALALGCMMACSLVACGTKTDTTTTDDQTADATDDAKDDRRRNDR